MPERSWKECSHHNVFWREAEHGPGVEVKVQLVDDTRVTHGVILNVSDAALNATYPGGQFMHVLVRPDMVEFYTRIEALVEHRNEAKARHDATKVQYDRGELDAQDRAHFDANEHYLSALNYALKLLEP